MTEKRKYGSIPVIMSPKAKKNPGSSFDDIIPAIFEVSEETQHTLYNRLIKLMEESGEIAEEVLIKEGFKPYKEPGKDGVDGEIADAIIVLLMAFEKNGGTVDELQDLLSKNIGKRTDPIETEARRAASDPSFVHHEWYIEHHLNYVKAIAHALKPRAQPDEKEIINHMVWMHDYPKMMGDKDNFELVRELVAKHKGEAYADELVGYLEDMEMIKSVDSMYGVETTIFALIMSTADALAHYYGPFFQIYHDENPDTPIEELKQKNAEKLEKDKRKLRAGPMEGALDSVKFQYKGRKVRVVGNEHIADLVTRKNPSSADFFPGDANVAHPSLISQTIPITSLQGDWRHGKFAEEDPFEEYFEE